MILNKIGVSRLKYGKVYTNAVNIVEMDITITNDNRYIAHKGRVDIDKYNPTESLAKHLMNGMVIIHIEEYCMYDGTAGILYIPMDKQKVRQDIAEVKNDINCIIDRLTGGSKQCTINTRN